MTFLAIWQQKNPGQPDPDEATLSKFIEPIRVAYREENPGQPMLDDAALYVWLCEQERRDTIEQWREAHPGQPLPDTYEEMHRWVIDEHNLMVLNFLRTMGEKFH
jgi:hypothetical protein